MTFAIALAIAVGFWGARGVPTNCTPVPVVVQAGTLPVVDGREAIAAADIAGCRVLIGPELQEWRRIDPGYYATVITHEVGHLDGIGHAPDGFMSLYGCPVDRRCYPFEVRKYVSRMRGVCPVWHAGYEHAYCPRHTSHGSHGS